MFMRGEPELPKWRLLVLEVISLLGRHVLEVLIVLVVLESLRVDGPASLGGGGVTSLGVVGQASLGAVGVERAGDAILRRTFHCGAEF